MTLSSPAKAGEGNVSTVIPGRSERPGMTKPNKSGYEEPKKWILI
jgi:hypothetical protein